MSSGCLDLLTMGSGTEAMLPSLIGRQAIPSEDPIQLRASRNLIEYLFHENIDDVTVKQ
jgi:hypothetical protein